MLKKDYSVKKGSLFSAEIKIIENEGIPSSPIESILCGATDWIAKKSGHKLVSEKICTPPEVCETNFSKILRRSYSPWT